MENKIEKEIQDETINDFETVQMLLNAQAMERSLFKLCAHNCKTDLEMARCLCSRRIVCSILYFYLFDLLLHRYPSKVFFFCFKRNKLY